jgi:hypothetical protein
MLKIVPNEVGWAFVDQDGDWNKQGNKPFRSVRGEEFHNQMNDC